MSYLVKWIVRVSYLGYNELLSEVELYVDSVRVSYLGYNELPVK